MTLPNFIIIGATKCGTTTLYSWLKQHPDICMSSDKEPTVFVSEIPAKLNVSDYEWLCPVKRKRTGEASVIYLYDSESAMLIKNKLGKDVILSALENLAARNSRLIETYHILTNAYGIFWCYCFAKL